MEDETILRLLPVLRRAWSLRGQQAEVPIRGRNAKRVMFATLNLRTGHRICLRGANMRRVNFHALLSEVRRRYAQRPVWILLDEAPCHIAAQSQALAAALDIHMVWLPKQCSELNSMDQLWKELKGKVSANHQFSSIGEEADYAEGWLMSLTNKEVLRKAVFCQRTFGYGLFCNNFWLLT
jgi:transposase